MVLVVTVVSDYFGEKPIYYLEPGHPGQVSYSSPVWVPQNLADF